jgi:hypothetical protein
MFSGINFRMFRRGGVLFFFLGVSATRKGAAYLRKIVNSYQTACNNIQYGGVIIECVVMQ